MNDLVISVDSGLAPTAIQETVGRALRLEQSMLGMPQADCPIRHYWAPGLYAREMSIAAGITVTGAIHKTENLICVSLGRLAILTDEGSREVSAGETFTCKPGMKNAVHAMEDSRWTNFFANPTDEQDPDLLVEILTESKASDLMGGSNNIQLAANRAAEIKES